MEENKNNGVSLADLLSETDTGSGVASPTEKEEVSLSDIPVEEESIPEEFLHKTPDQIAEDTIDNGELDEYIKKITRNREDVVNAINEHNEKVAAALGEEVPEEITDDDIARSKEEIEARHITNEDLEKAVDPDRVDDIEDLEDDDDLEEDIEDGDIDETEQLPESLSLTKEDIEEDEEKLDTEKEFEEFQNDIADKLSSVSKKFNISGFTVLNSSVDANEISSIIEHDIPVVDWGLMNTKAHIAMKQFSGSDIAKLGESTNTRTYQNVMKKYKLILDHLTGPNKPKSVVSFTKAIPISDEDYLYGAMYVGAFGDANFLPYDCDNKSCGHTFMSDNIPMEQMYHFSNGEEGEKEFEAIRTAQENEYHDAYVSEIVPISEDFAVSFRDPSIYSVRFEPTLLTKEFIDKYEDIITMLAYIDNIYAIDAENKTLAKIDTKVFPNNKVKTLKSRIIQYAKIICSLPADSYNLITAYIGELSKPKKNEMIWEIPEATCPKCGKKIAKRRVTAENLLFTRHQLAALASTQLN